MNDQPPLCVVCGKLCGPLKGQTKSWRCAGRLPRIREQIEAMQGEFAGDGKTLVRNLIVQLARYRSVGSVLDLFGGGRSAELFRQALPHAEIVSCERNQSLWPLLRVHSRLTGYEPHCGEVQTVKRVFDFVWLDLCGPWSADAEELVARAARTQLAYLPGARGTLAITLMPARERDPYLARSRTISIPAWVQVATRLPLLYVHRYPRRNGQEMWVLILGGQLAEPPDFIQLHDSINNVGAWVAPEFEKTLVKLRKTLSQTITPSMFHEEAA